MEDTVESHNQKALAAIREVGRAVVGKEDCIVKIMAVILAGGHVLLNDIPGVGKTTMAAAFARVLGLETKRVQFTPDVLPSDILGFSIYSKAEEHFIFQPGPIFSSLFLADELNRTSPKTQSALLEAMEEGHVSVEGTTYRLPSPFIVIATQNPSGSAGTQLLPDSQMDRFMICISMGYPEPEDELIILKNMGSGYTLKEIQPIFGKNTLFQMRKCVEEVYLENNMYEYILQLVNASRNEPSIDVGVSTRGSLHLVAMAKSMAFLRGRNYVIPEDIQDIFIDTVSHRLILSLRAKASGLDGQTAAEELLEKTKKPAIRGKYKVCSKR